MLETTRTIVKHLAPSLASTSERTAAMCRRLPLAGGAQRDRGSGRERRAGGLRLKLSQTSIMPSLRGGKFVANNFVALARRLMRRDVTASAPDQWRTPNVCLRLLAEVRRIYLIYLKFCRRIATLNASLLGAAPSRVILAR